MPESRVFLVSLCLCILLSQKVLSLSCGECRPAECEVRDCQYGTAKDACRCCDVCAKGEREECGGLWGLGGTCAANLICTFSSLPEGANFHFFRTGICLPEEFPVEDNLTH